MSRITWGITTYDSKNGQSNLVDIVRRERKLTMMLEHRQKRVLKNRPWQTKIYREDGSYYWANSLNTPDPGIITNLIFTDQEMF